MPSRSPKHYPTTPDGRYFVVRGRLWRCANPSLSDDESQRHVKALMDARRAVAKAKRAGDDALRRDARRRVNDAKVALGERGPVWWDDGQPDQNRRMVWNTSYRDWYLSLPADRRDVEPPG